MRSARDIVLAGKIIDGITACLEARLPAVCAAAKRAAEMQQKIDAIKALSAGGGGSGAPVRPEHAGLSGAAAAVQDTGARAKTDEGRGDEEGSGSREEQRVMHARGRGDRSAPQGSAPAMSDDGSAPSRDTSIARGRARAILSGAGGARAGASESSWTSGWWSWLRA